MHGNEKGNKDAHSGHSPTKEAIAVSSAINHSLQPKAKEENDGILERDCLRGGSATCQGTKEHAQSARLRRRAPRCRARSNGPAHGTLRTVRAYVAAAEPHTLTLPSLRRSAGHHRDDGRVASTGKGGLVGPSQAIRHRLHRMCGGAGGVGG